MVKTSLVKINCLILAAATMVGAQDSRANERQLPGQLNSTSPLSDDRHYEVRTIDLVAGKRYAISAKSEAFDTKLRVSFADDNDETIAEDDDGGDGTNSYLEITAARSGKHRIRVTSYDNRTGPFTIGLEELRPLPAPTQPKAIGSTSITIREYAGEFTASDGEVRGRRVDDYLFRFEAGKQVFLYMDRESKDMDPLLEVYLESQMANGSPIQRDDDGGDELNAFIRFIPEVTGNYIVRATAATNESAMGRYKLRVGQEP
ncbi:MAG TPA: hypothetical protein VFG34_01340 [Sphingopyxis sp.]|nr:hypothetical protein [Sphingopyxis sp.]